MLIFFILYKQIYTIQEKPAILRVFLELYKFSQVEAFPPGVPPKVVFV
jgi:hypothetical protein